MSITVDCQCGKRISSEDRFAQQTTNCPDCQGTLTISAPPEAATANSHILDRVSIMAQPDELPPAIPGAATPAVFQHADLRNLEGAAVAASVNAFLRSSGIGSLLFGAIATVMGFSMMEDNPINLILALIGIGLFLEGLWLVIDPRPIGLIVDGLALIVLGVWNLAVTLGNARAGGPPLFAILGVFQIIWGFQRFLRYGQTAKQSARHSPEVRKQVQDVVQAVLKAAPESEAGALALNVNGQVWKGMLWQEAAAFVSADGAQAHFARPDEVGLVVRETRKRKSRVTLSVGGRELEAEMADEQLARLQTWLSITTRPLVIEDAGESRAPIAIGL